MDNTLHAGGPINGVGGIFTIPPQMGKTVGPNLFESFGTFVLGTGDTADFQSGGATNIIARVTGGGPSSIDGTMQSDANLFFLNPAGVFFGPDASLNVAGAFVVSTANYVKLSDGTSFYADASHPTDDAGLTASPVSAFGFLTNQPGPVSFYGGNFYDGTGLHVIAGSITLDGATTLAAGDLTLFSAASPLELPFNLAAPSSGFATVPFSSLGSIAILDGSSVLTGGSTGRIVIRGGQLIVDDSVIRNENDGDANSAGTLDVSASLLVVQDSANVSSVVTGNGNGAPINLTSDNLYLGDASVESYTSSGGKAGDIQVYTQSLSLYGNGSDCSIASFCYGGALGNSGNVNVNASGSVEVIGAQIDAISNSPGAAGSVDVGCQNLLINGDVSGGIFTNSNSGGQAGYGGNAGSTTVTVQEDLTMVNNATIASDVYQAGAAGEVSVSAGSMFMDHSSIDSSSRDGSLGPSRDVTVDVTGALQLMDQAYITTSSDTVGDAGNIVVHAQTLTITGVNNGGMGGQTGISSEANSADPTVLAKAGSVHVVVPGTLTLRDGGEIRTDTETSGAAGDIIVQAGALAMEGSKGSESPTGIVSDSELGATGQGGEINLVVQGPVSLSKAIVSASTSTADTAGKIFVQSASLTLRNGSTISTTSAKNGGDIDLHIADLLYLFDSEISTAAKMNGGDILIDPQLLVLDDSSISADAKGVGGNITIFTPDLLKSTSFITATGSRDGVIDLSTPDLDLGGILLALPATLASGENRLRERCARSVDREFSSLVVVGRGGTEEAPDELQSDFGMDEVRSAPTLLHAAR